MLVTATLVRRYYTIASLVTDDVVVCFTLCMSCIGSQQCVCCPAVLAPACACFLTIEQLLVNAAPALYREVRTGHCHADWNYSSCC